jgi:hypothetical protein
MTVARGLMIEKHVCSWFSRNWPFNVISADNDGKWDRYCDHDFKLQTGTGSIITVDVSGEKRGGGFGRPERKPTADIHVLASESKGFIFIDGFVTRRNYITKIPPHKIAPISALVCWANCQKYSIDYNSLV